MVNRPFQILLRPLLIDRDILQYAYSSRMKRERITHDNQLDRSDFDRRSRGRISPVWPLSPPAVRPRRFTADARVGNEGRRGLCPGENAAAARPAFVRDRRRRADRRAHPGRIWFGWLPALLWILFGSIFIGGVHDYASLVASIRNKAASIAILVKSHLTPTAYRLFLIFMWLTLLYVIVAFTDITAQTFYATVGEFASGPGRGRIVDSVSVVGGDHGHDAL